MGRIVTKLTKSDSPPHWIECSTMSGDRSSEQHSIVLFTDVADGDELADRHREVATDVLDRIGGVEASETSGGIAATFTDANRALICAVQIQRSFEDWGSSKPAAPVRVALAQYEAAAAAIAAQATDGEILVTHPVRALTEPRGHLFTERGELQLNGSDVPLFAVRWWEHD